MFSLFQFLPNVQSIEWDLNRQNLKVQHMFLICILYCLHYILFTLLESSFTDFLSPWVHNGRNVHASMTVMLHNPHEIERISMFDLKGHLIYFSSLHFLICECVCSSESFPFVLFKYNVAIYAPMYKYVSLSNTMWLTNLVKGKNRQWNMDIGKALLLVRFEPHP
mgnify:CR=1 FL=1